MFYLFNFIFKNKLFLIRNKSKCQNRKLISLWEFNWGNNSEIKISFFDSSWASFQILISIICDGWFFLFDERNELLFWAQSIFEINLLRDILALIFFIFFVLSVLKSELINFYVCEAFHITKFFENTVKFWVWISEIICELFLITDFLWTLLTEDRLNVRKRGIDFWMFEFVMLIERSFRAVRFSAWFDRAFVESLDFMSISAESFGLFISFKRAVALLILNFMRGFTSYLLSLYLRWFFSSINSLTWLVSAILARNNRQYSW